MAWAGVGVEGWFDVVVVEDCAGCGAAGGAGVEVDATGAGVDGPAAFDAGAGFGYDSSVNSASRSRDTIRLTLLSIHTMKPFSSILYDSTVLASARTLPAYC